MRKNKNGYYRNNHSYFLLQYHLVLVTKYRHPVITDRLEERLKEYTMAYFKERGYPVLAIETMPDHIHILFEMNPQTSLAEFVNAFKSASSRIMRKEFPDHLSKWYWKPYFWTRSYFIGSISERTTEAVKHYIDKQKTKEK